MHSEENDSALKKNTFRKNERLNSKIAIEELFKKGSSFFLFPFKIKYMDSSSIKGVSILISVPKRSFKRAVDRNRIKRLIRESYRLHKHELLESLKLQDKGLIISFIYAHNQILDFQSIENKLSLVLNRLQKEFTI